MISSLSRLWFRLFYCGFFCCISATTSAQSGISVIDDAQRVVSLVTPATRIVSLSPHTTELVFAAGAGHLLIGVSEYSDFPEAAKKIPSIGSVFALDLERLIALKPDIVIIWGTGNAKSLAKKLRENHLTVFESEPHNYEMIATSIERIALLSGTESTGKIAAVNFRQRLEQLKRTYQIPANQTPIRVFYQIAKKPLMTINQHHVISTAISLCGGKNVFDNLKELSATITTEALLIANPDVIITGGKDSERVIAEWSPFTNLAAVKKHNLYAINGDLMYRASPRILEGTEALCKYLANARKS